MQTTTVSRANSGSSPQQPSGSMINRSITISVSYMEIYNESVNDLLDKDKRNLDVRDHKGEVIVENLTCKKVNSTEEILQLVKLGEEIRIRAETKVNSKSTRSHTVFRINVQIDDLNVQTGRREIRTSQIQIVDLAGSEGASKTHSIGLRFREGSNINRSLLALSSVI